jgi:hypothetical protein
MYRRLYLFSALLLVFTNAALRADDPPPGEPLPGFKSGSLILDITARVVEQNQVVIWNENHRRVTIPGSPVGIKLVGANVVVAVQFTPYRRRGGQNVLVAQGQIWVEVPGQGIRYQTSIQTIPLEFDDPVYFFPLGSSEEESSPRIEIMLTIKPYREAETETSGRPAAANTPEKDPAETPP